MFAGVRHDVSGSDPGVQNGDHPGLGTKMLWISTDSADAKANIHIPIIFVTGDDDISMTVRSFHILTMRGVLETSVLTPTVLLGGARCGADCAGCRALVGWMNRERGEVP
jgi:hypothetical protein